MATWQLRRYQNVSTIRDSANEVRTHFLSRDKCLEYLPSPFMYSLSNCFVKLWTALLIGPAEKFPISPPFALLIQKLFWASDEGFKIASCVAPQYLHAFNWLVELSGPINCAWVPYRVTRVLGAALVRARRVDVADLYDACSDWSTVGVYNSVRCRRQKSPTFFASICRRHVFSRRDAAFWCRRHMSATFVGESEEIFKGKGKR